MALWRLHLRPDKLVARNVVDHCLQHGLLGLGWGGLEEVPGESTSDYLARHQSMMDGKRVRAVHAMLEMVRKDDLIWARDADGGYLLGRAKGAPHPRFGKWEALQDMYHVVPVDIIGGRSGVRAIADTEVPGAVKASFSRRGSTLQQLHDKHLLNYSEWLFASKMGESEPKLESGSFLDLLDPFELEDLVVLYLQEFGWRIVLSSHAHNTPRFEATFVHPDRGTAGVQVKHKGQDLDAARYAEDPQVDRVFLFAASGHYGEARPKNVEIVDPGALVVFAKQRRSVLPVAIRYWLDRSSDAHRADHRQAAPD